MSAICGAERVIDCTRPPMAEVCNVAGPATEVELLAGGLWHMRGDQRWRVIICVRGMVWVTQERDLQDYVLEAGQAFIVTQPGQVLVQALETACFQVTSAAAVAPYAGRYPIFS